MSQANVGFCTTKADQIVTNLKYIFVFDHSGSNQQNYLIMPPAATTCPGGGGVISDGNINICADPDGGTDPTGTKRFPPLVNFLQNITDNPNTYYSSINFSDTANEFFNWTDNSGVKTTKAAAITNFQGQPDGWMTPMAGKPVADNQAPTDGGNTNYLDTLKMINTNITSDIQAAVISAAQGNPIVATDYVIFWVSDGAPYMPTGLQNPATIYGAVQAMMALKTQYPDYVDSITLSTGFYATADENLSSEYDTAVTIMTTMATFGQGSFINFATDTIDFTKFIVPARLAKYELRDFWIQNASAVWWNGKLMLDSDNDGIPDAIEATMGSLAGTYDSDGNGVGDGVEFFLYGTPCKDANCAKNNARSFQAQCGSMPPGGYPDYDGDFLNNCEETLLGSKFDDPDSNVDWVPDAFEWVNKLNFVAGTSNLLSVPFNDGYTNYQKLKLGLPIGTPASSVSGGGGLSYSLAQISDDPSQTCFQVNVQNLAVLSPQDTIRAYVMQSRGVAGNVRHMRVAKKVTNGQLTLTDSDFSQ